MTRLVEDIIARDQPLTGRSLLDALQAAAAMMPSTGEGLEVSDGGGNAKPGTIAITGPKRERNVTYHVEVTGSVLFDAGSPDGNRWKYAWQEVIQNGFVWNVRAGGINSVDRDQMLNIAEARNSDMGIQGNGVDIDQLPTGFALTPIPDGRVILLTEITRADGTRFDYWCDFNNAVGGQCEP